MKTYVLVVLCPECGEEVSMGKVLDLTAGEEVRVELSAFESASGICCSCGSTVRVDGIDNIITVDDSAPVDWEASGE